MPTIFAKNPHSLIRQEEKRDIPGQKVEEKEGNIQPERFFRKIERLGNESASLMKEIE